MLLSGKQIINNHNSKIISTNHLQNSARALITCNPNEYEINGSCELCHALCLSCSGNTINDCLSCDSTKQLVQSGSILPPFSCECQTGYYLNNNTCSPCDQSCLKCNGSTSNNCIDCKGSQFRNLQGSQCICQIGYYDLNDGSICQQCDSTCTACYLPIGDSTQICTSCVDKREVKDGKCICKLTYYEDNLNQCQSCINNCLSCNSTNPLSCDQCTENRIFNGSICKCPIGYYDFNNSQCIQCLGYCDNCDSSKSTGCDQCQLNRVFSGSSCICQQGYYEDITNNCMKCHDSCLTCSGPSSTECLSCSSLKTLSNGVCQCNKGYYEDPLNFSCLACYYYCRYCSGPSQNQCTACRSNRVLQNGFCPCKQTYYENSNNQCSPCDPSCQTCTDSLANSCLTCKNNRTLVGTTCFCNQQFYEDSITKVCTNCHYSCQTCSSGGQNMCLTCQANRIFSGGNCNCDIGYFDNSTLQVCSQCHYSCSTCSNSTSNGCITCQINRTNSGGVCSCNLGYYNDTSSLQCELCDSSCSTCSYKTKFNCITCSINRTLINGICICNDGFYEDSITKNCIACHYSCSKCLSSGSNNCIACQSNRTISGGTCTCDTGFYDSSISQQCELCNYSCLTCANGTTSGCLTCQANRTIFGGICSCNSGYFDNLSSKLCEICNNTCDTCSSGTSNDCLSCNGLRILNGTQCICQPGYFENILTKVCTKCHYSCATCTLGTNQDCLVCQQNRTKSSNICQCNQGYYENITLQQCSQCHSSCNTCNGPNSTDCTSCNSAQYRIANNTTPTFSCLCQPAYYEDLNLICQKCHNFCQNCNGPNSTDCTSCNLTDLRIPNTILSPFSCICIDKYYSDQVNSLCQACHYSCSTCTGDSSLNSCTSCDSKYQRTLSLPNQKSQCTCNQSYYNDGTNQQCQPCDKTCLECDAPQSTQCTKCDSSRNFIQSNTSTPFSCKCKPNTFYDDQIVACISCNNVCFTCDGIQKNQCLSCYDFQNRVLQGTNCVCKAGYFENTNGLCQLCHSSCLNCVGPTSYQCTECDSTQNRFFNSNYSTCQCNQGYYDILLPFQVGIITTQTCLQCNSLCKECNTSNNTCLTCINNLVILDYSTSICTCPSGLYLNTIDQICYQCHFTCQECIGPNKEDCLSCKSNMISSPSYVQIYSPFKQLYICTCQNDNTNYNCIKCHPSCKPNFCNPDEPNICLQCKANSSITSISINGEIQKLCICNDGYYENGLTSECEQCNPNCVTCIGNTANECLSCDQKAYKILKQYDQLLPTAYGYCICEGGYYEEEQTLSCQKCSQSCMECLGSSSYCTVCYENSFLTNRGECLCNSGYYQSQITGKCIKCHYSCMQCDGETEDQCLSCTSSTRIFENKSSSSNLIGSCPCIEGYFDAGIGICKKCDAQCLTCVGSSDYCLECYPEETNHRNLINNKCPCKQSYYENSEGLCLHCPYDCLTCNSNKDCLTCISNDRQLNPLTQRCVCKEGLFESDTGSCEKCSYKCKNCEITAQTCTECFLGGQLNNDLTCECSDGYYAQTPTSAEIANIPDIIYNMCKPCSYQCQTCQNSSTCLSCKSSNEHIFMNNDNQLCECYFGFEMKVNHQANSYICVKQAIFTIVVDSQMEKQDYINDVFLYLLYAYQFSAIISLLLGQYLISDFGTQMIFDIQVLLYFDGQKPSSIIQFLEILHNNSIQSWLNYINPFQNIFEQDYYLNYYLEKYKISTNIYNIAGGHLLLWLVILILNLVLKKTIFHNRFTLIDQIYKIVKGRIFLSRIYNLFIKKAFISLSNFSTYYLMFAMMIAKEDQTLRLCLSNYLIFFFIVCCSIYKMKTAKAEFSDPFQILHYKYNTILSYQVSLSKIILSGILFEILVSVSDLYYIIWIIILKILIMFPLNLIKFRGQKVNLYLIASIQILFISSLFILTITIAKCKLNQLTEYQKIDILNNCFAFKFIICTIILIIQIQFLLDSIQQIYKFYQYNYNNQYILDKVYSKFYGLYTDQFNYTNDTLKSQENQFIGLLTPAKFLNNKNERTSQITSTSTQSAFTTKLMLKHLKNI